MNCKIDENLLKKINIFKFNNIYILDYKNQRLKK